MAWFPILVCCFAVIGNALLGWNLLVTWNYVLAWICLVGVLMFETYKYTFISPIPGFSFPFLFTQQLVSGLVPGLFLFLFRGLFPPFFLGPRLPPCLPFSLVSLVYSV